MAVRREVVELPDRNDDLGLEAQQTVCANPRCDEQFYRTLGPGRPRDFHSEECRRTAERDLRKTQVQLDHHVRQVEQLRARASAYLRTGIDGETEAGAPSSDEQMKVAREAVAVVSGMARFLEKNQGEFAADLLKLYNAVSPIIR
jgi:hypothetical protein